MSRSSLCQSACVGPVRDHNQRQHEPWRKTAYHFPTYSRAYSGCTGAHDAHDPRRNLERDAIRLHRDSRAQRAAYVHDHLETRVPELNRTRCECVMLNLAYLVVGVVVIEVVFTTRHGTVLGRPCIQTRHSGGTGLWSHFRRRLHRPQHGCRHRVNRSQPALAASEIGEML